MLLQKTSKQIRDEKKIKKLVEQAIKENTKTVSDYQQGKTAALEFLMGQVQRLAKGRAEPAITRKILLEKLKK